MAHPLEYHMTNAFLEQSHIAFKVRYLPDTAHRQSRLKVYCSVSNKTATYSYTYDDDSYRAAVKQFLKDHPLKYYIVREDTIKCISNPAGNDALYIAEADFT